ncbi:UvrB/UvrC motif-containing protein [Candidatus Pacearchaeota archaeon]|nr:UvrB/UvrC motif-containing protein [Candidatus Pacearchaeota archaeon]
MKENKIRDGEIGFHDTHIGIWEETVNEKDFKQVYDKIIRHLRNRGFKVFRCPNAKKHYRCISKTIHKGGLNQLELAMRMSGRHIEVEFFQNLNVDNSNGGQYDFDKFDRMPYLMQRRFIVEAAHLIDMLVNQFGYQLGKKLLYAPEGSTTAKRIIEAISGIHSTKNPLESFNDGWDAKRFERDENGWPVPKEFDYGCNKDREGVPLRNGMTRYFRDRNGYLRRAVIYTNMNSMWHVIYGHGRTDHTYLSCGELFSLQPTDRFGRWFYGERRTRILEPLKAKAIKEENFEKAAIIRDILKQEAA